MENSIPYRPNPNSIYSHPSNASPYQSSSQNANAMRSDPNPNANNPYAKPNPNANSNPTSNPNYNSNKSQSSYQRPQPPTGNPNAGYGRDVDEDGMTQKEREEKLFQEKLTIVFHGINTIDDLITLKEQYSQKATQLQSILDKSAIREGEILRNKNRNRDSYKDPALVECRRLQDDIKRRLDEVYKMNVEIDKRIRQYNKIVRNQLDTGDNANNAGLSQPSNYEALLIQNSNITSSINDDEQDEEEDEFEYENSLFEYFDPGSHWCRDCDKMVPKIQDYFEHLHSKDHWKLAPNELKLWRKQSKKPSIAEIISGHNANKYGKVEEKTKSALKGAQFLIPIKGFYCPICSLYMAENSVAEEHLKSAKHNRLYKRFTLYNQDYEHKWSTDKGKALGRHQQSERKRQKEEEEKQIVLQKKKEEMRIKEEKEAKKKKREEDKEREERERGREEREKERHKFNKSLTSNSSDRFRLKDVTTDLKSSKDSKSWSKEKDKHKERSREREREKNKKRIYSSSDDSSPSSSHQRKKRTYFGDPYEDPKLKLKTFVHLTRLNRKTAKRFYCDQLIKLIDRPKDFKLEVKAPNSPIKLEIDVNNDEEVDSKNLKGVVDDILKGLDDDKDVKESIDIKSVIKSDDSHKDVNKEESNDNSKDSLKVVELAQDIKENNANEDNVDNKDKNKEEDNNTVDNKLSGNLSTGSDKQLVIETNVQKDEIMKENESNDDNVNKEEKVIPDIESP
ncbi:myb-like protein X [Oppia nitens]|uniref:myb-like protein X n=1 Tax=Oppia nitens TaxID=1686743 RepID=UPI0023D9E3D1|nr:myb-like protein X [Oppia nitens]